MRSEKELTVGRVDIPAPETLSESIPVPTPRSKPSASTRLSNNPLILEPDFNHSGLIGKRVYVGFGVAGRKGLSVAVPLDILALIIVAELVRRVLGASGITFLIADSHAQRTGNYDPSKVREAAIRRKHIIDRSCQALGVPDPQVYFASEIEHDPLYQALVEEAASVAHGDAEYFVREAADIEFFRRAGGVGMKIGWSLGSTKNAARFDEQAFDRFYLEMFPKGKQMKFVYASAGRTLDPSKAKAAPYLDFESRTRVLLTQHEDVEGKLAACSHQATKKAALDYYEAIIDSWEHLSGLSLDGKSVVQKIENLITALTADMEDPDGNAK
jgi:hypothetical protein